MREMAWGEQRRTGVKSTSLRGQARPGRAACAAVPLSERGAACLVQEARRGVKRNQPSEPNGTLDKGAPQRIRGLRPRATRLLDDAQLHPPPPPLRSHTLQGLGWSPSPRLSDRIPCPDLLPLLGGPDLGPATPPPLDPPDFPRNTGEASVEEPKTKVGKRARQEEIQARIVSHNVQCMTSSCSRLIDSQSWKKLCNTSLCFVAPGEGEGDSRAPGNMGE